MRRATAVGIAAALILFETGPEALGAVVVSDYKLSVLAPPPGATAGAAATAWAVNAEGSIVGWYGAGATSTANALGFLATPDVTDYTVAKFPRTGDYTWVQPYDISPTGVIVGQSRPANQTIRFAFGKTDPATPLLGMLRFESEATGINATGQVVGWRTVNGSIQAFYYDGTTASELPPFAQSPVRESRALGINDTGQIVGYYRAGSATEFRGFVYGNALLELGPITVQEPPLVTDWLKTYDAVSINNRGQVATTTLAGPSVSHAVLFNGIRPTDLGVVAGYEESFAAGISEKGWVVGFLRDADVDPTGDADKSGFLWANGTMIDLNSLEGLPEGFRITLVHDAHNYIEDPSNPLLQKAIIVGQGTSQNITRAFAMEITLQVPEPHTYAMLGLGLLAIGALRMRRAPPHG